MTAVLGYRAFRVNPDHGVELRSWVMDAVWHRGVNEAVCPDPKCGGPPPREHAAKRGCGFHAFAELEQLAHHIHYQGEPVMAPPPPHLQMVCAVVAASGTVQLWSKGWRSSHAEIVALLGDTPLGRLAARRYAVPTLPLPKGDLRRAEGYFHEWGMTHAEALSMKGAADA